MRSARKALIVAAAGGLVLALSWHQPVGEFGSPPTTSAEVSIIEGSPPRPAAFLLRLCAKEMIAGEVAAGRRTLWEAAALFGTLNRLPPETADVHFLAHAEVPIPARTPDERLCWQVVRWVLVNPRLSAAEAKAVVARLTAEFQAELRTKGLIRLPDPAGLESAESLIERSRGLPEAHLLPKRMESAEQRLRRGM